MGSETGARKGAEVHAVKPSQQEDESGDERRLLGEELPHVLIPLAP